MLLILFSPIVYRMLDIVQLIHMTKKNARTTRVAVKLDTLNELVRLPVLHTASKAMQN